MGGQNSKLIALGLTKVHMLKVKIELLKVLLF